MAAHAPSASYRLGKFVRRNRVIVTAAATAVLALAVAATTSTAFYFREQRARERAQLDADRSRLELESIRALHRMWDDDASEFIERSASALELHRMALGADSTELVDLLRFRVWMVQLLEGLEGDSQPEYRELMTDWIDEAARIGTELPDSEASLESTESIAEMLHWNLRRAGQPHVSREIEFRRRALRWRRAQSEPDAPMLGRSLQALAYALAEQGDAAATGGDAGAAEASYREAIDLMQQVPAGSPFFIDSPTDVGQIAASSNERLTMDLQRDLGWLLAAQGRYAEAEPLVLAAWEVGSADYVERLVTFYEDWGRPAEAAKDRIAR